MLYLNDMFVSYNVLQADKARTFATRVYCVGVKDFDERQVHSLDVNIFNLYIVYFIFILSVIVSNVYFCI